MDDRTNPVKPVVMKATGPATMFPKVVPQPERPHVTKPLWNFLATSTRGPFITALILHLVLAKYFKRLAEFLSVKLGSHRVAFGFMLPIVHGITYTTSFALFEFIERNEIFERYRIGRTPGQEPSWEMKRVAYWESARGWPSMFVGGQIMYFLLQERKASALLDPLPSIWKTALHISGNLFVSNVTFYIIHRILHHGPIYTRIHKKHHEFVGVKSVAAQSLHPVESILQTLPSFLGGVLFSTHPIVWLHFLGWRVYTGMEGHSGYSFRGSWLHKIGLTNGDDAAYHDCHHTSSGNFGTYYLDWLFGTQDYWLSIGEEDGYLELCRRREQEAKQRM